MYNDNYLKSFRNGILKTEFKINQNPINQDLFFSQLNNLITHKTRIFFYGNGASMAFASHMSLDWHKNGKIQSHTLSDISLLTAYMNDFSKEEMFAEHLKSFKVCEHDIVCTISSSGNSSNVIGALKLANSNKANTIAFSGLNEDNLSVKVSKFSVYVPLKTYGQVECAHQLFLHLWLDRFMGITEWSRLDPQNMNSKGFKL